MGEHSLQRVGAGIRREWRDCHLRQLVGNMPRVDRHHAVHRTCDFVNAEGLYVARIVVPRRDNAFFADIRVVQSRDGIHHFQFVLPVALLRDKTLGRFGKSPQTVVDKFDFTCRIENRLHRHHHLGISSILVTPAPKMMPVVPGCSTGNSPPERIRQPFLLTLSL